MGASGSPPPALRWEGETAPPRVGVPIPPARMPPVRGGRPLKRWRYVAAFCDELMLCAAAAALGPVRSSWWTVWERRRGVLAERTRTVGRALVRFDAGGRVRVDDGRVTIDLAVDEGGGVETVNPHGRQYVWTRKQAARPVHGRVVLDGRPIELDGLAVVDDTAGFHARETEWWWSAGVGRARDGSAVGWNLVTGVNDGPTASERTIWCGDRSWEAGPVAFAADLSAVTFADGGGLVFVAEAVRERRTGAILARSDYRQPFGMFSGRLPGVGALDSGLGVMEHHVAHW